MNNISNKNISLFFIFLLSVLIFGMAYNSSMTYKEYIEVEKSEKYINLIEKFDNILHIIEKEKSYNSMSLKNQLTVNSKDIEAYRKKIKGEISSALLYVDKNLEFTSYRGMLEELSEMLKNHWSGNKTLETKECYFKVVSSLVHAIKKLTPNITIDESNKASYFIELLKLEESLNKEEDFISNILYLSKKMSDEDLLLWEAFVKSDVVPDFSGLGDILLRTKLDSMLEKKYFVSIGEVERGKVFVGLVDGKYTISVDEWSNTFRNKINRLISIEEVLLSDIKGSINASVELSKNKLYKYLLIFVLLFIILLVFLYVYSNIDKNSRLLSDTLKDIEADLDEKQKREIKEVIRKNDTREIYKFLANAIKEPSRAKDHFLANMSHEIRTPLNGIIGFTNILKETELQEDQREFVSIIEDSSNNLIRIVNDILDFSKVSSGKVEFENESFNVMEKFEASIDAYAAKAAQKDIELSLYIDPELPVELMGDSTKISQIMINLLSNAIKFTKEKGTIKVDIEKHSETDKEVKVRFSVKDSGIGISKDQQSKIFDAFSQADASTNRKFGGTGLGLTISSKFVELMGGKLNIESKENDGTTFYFLISLKKPENLKRRKVPKLNCVNVIYIYDDKYNIDKNLKHYITYTGAKFEKYSYKSILEKGKNLSADIIFVEHRAIKNDSEMEYLLSLNSKVVLLTNTKMSSFKNSIKDKISKTIFKPVNFTKTIKALTMLSHCNKLENKNITKVKSINAQKVFNGLNVLVAEDNVINQKLIKSILNGFDINVTIASNGEEVVHCYKEQPYDMIFMDIQMPIMSGVEATEKILEYEQEQGLKHTPIVALTANVIESDKQKYLSSGMDKYLRKPIDVKELLVIIEEYFPIQKLRDSLSLDYKIEHIDKKKSNIILFKELDLTGKIYSAVLSNLGYEVDVYSDQNEFLEYLDKKKYTFALFDVNPFRRVHSEKLVVDLIRDSGATPIAFVEKDNNSNYCATLKLVDGVKEIEHKLMCS
jgi:signal transduction histidine kinase/DNA-binding response OmpR family regulator